jgi:hypothetical protein
MPEKVGLKPNEIMLLERKGNTLSVLANKGGEWGVVFKTSISDLPDDNSREELNYKLGVGDMVILRREPNRALMALNKDGNLKVFWKSLEKEEEEGGEKGGDKEDKQ